MSVRELLGLAALVLAGCDAAGTNIATIVDPEIAELARVQAMSQSTAAAHRPRCHIQDEGCPRVYEITGDACLRMAQERMASGGAGPYATCADTRFGSLREAGVTDTWLRGLEAQRLVRETSSGAGAKAANDRLAVLAHEVNRPAANYYRASAVDWSVVFAGPVTCAAVQEAESQARQAMLISPVEGIDNRAAAGTLAERLAREADMGRCT